MAIALAILVPGVFAAQEPESEADANDGEEDETEVRHRPPAGPLVATFGTGRLYFLSALPAAYLDALAARRVDTDRRLDNQRTQSVRLGLRFHPRWMVEVEATSVDTKFGAANLRADVAYRAVNAFYTLSETWYATAGAGSISYDFRTFRQIELPRANTDFAVNAGLGGWMQPHFLGERFTWRTEARNYVSWLTVPGLETRVQHHLGIASGLEFSFP